jgi:hypothetical protein
VTDTIELLIERRASEIFSSSEEQEEGIEFAGDLEPELELRLGEL